MAHQFSAPVRRRNGKQQACEPCRKRKLACDHGYPTCQRCQKRKLAQQCVYIQPPKSGSPAGPQLSNESARSLTSDSPSRTARESLKEHPSGSYSECAHPSQWPLFEGTRAWMGPTSFNAVYHENRVQLEQLPSPPSPGTFITSNIWQELARRRGASSSKWVQLGIEVLREIPATEELCESLFSRHINPNEGWIKLAAKMVNESMWQTFGPVLRDRQEDNLSRMSQHICENHGINVKEDAADTNVWLQSFSGKNLQWESLGILFTYWAFGVLSTPVEDPIFRQPDGSLRERRQFVRQLKNCASSCIELYGTDGADSGNSLLVYLMFKRNMLDAVLETDAAPIVWRQHGELAALTMSLGLHRVKIYPSDEVPSVTSEARKRIFAAVFKMDKGVATFTGRPPLFSRRYTTSQALPLDVSDEALLAGGETLGRAIASLDDKGFNTDGKMYPTTILRARTLLAFVRDEILEISLGSNNPENISEYAARLKTSSTETYNNLSPCIKYHPDILSDKNTTGAAIYARTVIRLEHLENLFILERLLIKHGGGNMQELIDTSCEMLELTLVLWKHSNRFAGLHSDFEWMVTTYAAPTAGVLCIELLKQLHGTSRQTHRSAQPESSPVTRYNIPRSQTIQNLTLFVGFLDWIQISEPPTSDICSRIRHIVSRVLDDLLGGAATENRAVQPGSSQLLEGQTQPATTTLEADMQSTASFAQLDSLPTVFDFDNADLWNFELMDTYGWIDG